MHTNFFYFFTVGTAYPTILQIMSDRIKTIEPPGESLVEEVDCELVQVEQGGGFVGWARWFEGEKRANKGKLKP